MSSVDQRVVEMKFNNGSFLSGIRTTLSSLAKLGEGLKLRGASKGLEDVSAASKRFSLANMASSLDKISSKFTVMSAVALSALNNVVSKAVDAGLRIAKALTIAPIMSGLQEYETQLNSVQTILANTQKEGTKLKDVNSALNELNTYSDKTIYNFTEMAKNIGTFTSAGVKLKTSVESIKGIANLAALSGSNSQQASTAMYQLSQAISSGSVKLQDWNSVVNAGMGGQVFQDALKSTARAQGVAVDSMIKKSGSFRESLKNGWLSSKVLTETLKTFTGDLTDAQLKSMGYTSKQIVEIQKMAKTANDAATKVKTMSQLMDTLKEASGSGWAQTWQILFGNFDEAKKLFTGVSNVLGGMIGASAKARNATLQGWKDLGGRDMLIKAISNAFKALMQVVGVVKSAFREIFPAKTSADLVHMTKALLDFTEKLKMGSGTIDKVKRTLAGFFAIFGIAWEIVKQVAVELFGLFKTASSGGGSFLDITAKVGDFLVGLHKAIVEGDGFVNFFEKVGNVIRIPIELIRKFVGYIKGLFSGVGDTAPLTDGIKTLGDSLSPLTGISEKAAGSLDKIRNFLSKIGGVIAPIASKLGGVVKNIGTFLGNEIKNINWDLVLSGIQTALFAGLVLIIKKFLGGIGKNKDLSQGLIGSIKEALGGVTESLSTMQTTLKATTLLEIALALGILTISVAALSRIDSEGLKRALAALAVMFTQLFASMAIFSRVTAGAGAMAKLPLVAAAMILLAIAIDILTVAVTALSKLSWEELAKGLGGVLVLMAALVAATLVMPSGAKLISTGLGLTALAVAIKILASAVKDLSGMSWQEMAKGLVGVGAILVALTLFTKFAGTSAGGAIASVGLIALGIAIKILASAVGDFASYDWAQLGKGLAGISAVLLAVGLFSASSGNSAKLILTGAGLVIVGLALKVLASALSDFAGFSWTELGKGLAGMAGALLLVGLAMAAIPVTGVLAAAGIAVTAVALKILADVMAVWSTMNWEDIGKSMVMLGGTLLIIALAMAGMTTALLGAAALIVVAGALAILAPILLLFAGMSWEEIAKGLGVLAGAFIIIGLAGLLLTPVIPTLLGLAAAIVILGAGMLLAGVGVLAFATGLGIIAAVGGAAAGAIFGIVKGLLDLLPKVGQKLAEAVISFAKTISTSGPAIQGAIGTVLQSFLNVITKYIPIIAKTMLDLMYKLIKIAQDNVGPLADKGAALIVAFAGAMTKNVGKVTAAAVDLIVKFIDAIGKNLSKIIDAGVRLIFNFINGVTKAVNQYSDALGKAGANLGLAVVTGMVKGLVGGVSQVVGAAKGLAQKALGAVSSIWDSHSPSKEFAKLGMWAAIGAGNGITEYTSHAVSASENLGKESIRAMSKSISGISSIVSDNMDATPVIRPVLDLTQVEKEAGRMGSMLKGRPIDLGGTYRQAKDASSEYASTRTQGHIDEITGSGKSAEPVSFTQNNYSPKALTPIEIYRQTKNQLATLRR